MNPTPPAKPKGLSLPLCIFLALVWQALVGGGYYVLLGVLVDLELRRFESIVAGAFVFVFFVAAPVGLSWIHGTPKMAIAWYLNIGFVIALALLWGLMIAMNGGIGHG